MLTGTRGAARHRKQVIDQIYLPLGVGVLCIAGAALGCSVAGVGSAGVWADIGLLWLTVLAMIAGMVVLAVLVAALAACVWLLRWIPPQAARIQALVDRVPAAVGRGADALARPVIVARSVGGAAARLWRRSP